MCVCVGEGEGMRTTVDCVGLFVGDLDAEFLFDGHDDLDGVETVEAEVVGKMRLACDLHESAQLLDTLVSELDRVYL